MNNGVFGEGFPYTNFHELNMDWIVKIAKDFLDQYSTIQTTINDGMTDLQNKADELEQLLQEWYNTHSQDIANQLVNALAEFNEQAQYRAEQTIASIPSDYTAFYNSFLELQKTVNHDSIYNMREVQNVFGSDLYTGSDIEEQYASGSYVFKWVPLDLPAGNYSITVTRMAMSPVGALKVKQSTVGSDIMVIPGPGTYQFTIGSVFAGQNGLLMQVSLDSDTTPGTYGAYGIHIFDTVVADKQALPNSLIGKKISQGLEVKRASTSGYQGDTINAGHSKQNNTLSLFANIAQPFNGVQLMHGYNQAYASGVVQVYNDRIDILEYTNALNVVQSIPHGLTLNTFIELSINVKEDNNADITLATLGGVFHTENVPFKGCFNSVQWNPIDSTMTNCVLTYSDNDKNKGLWIFGDSYLDHYPVFMHQYGYHYFALDGFSGRNSTQALWSLNMALDHCRIPEVLVWQMGMNDPDTDSAVNANWHSTYNTVKDICTRYGIELVLCTIPNTPTINNQFKNAIIRNSGYRYIDVAEAVGSDVNSGWYPGLLSGDNVHASEQGRKVIAMKMITSLPETGRTAF